MRRLCESAIGAALLAILTTGCGSSGSEDRLVWRFVGFDNTDLTQADQVGETSADVDVVQDLCAAGPPPVYECFTQTKINAIFINEGRADIQLQSYVVDTGSQTGISPQRHDITVNIPGGRCSNSDRACAVDDDCLSSGGTGTCLHTDTTVHGLLLFDVTEKTLISHSVVQSLTVNVNITFYGEDDAANERTVATSYSVTFADFNNCNSPACSQSGG